MPLFDAMIGAIARLLDTIIADPKARDAARRELLALQGTQEMEALKAQFSAIVGEAQGEDPWTRRARPSFLYVIYAIILWAIPIGLIAAVAPDLARRMSGGMNAYLSGIPEPLWMLFGTGYLGYKAARQWGKARGAGKYRP